VRTPISSLVLLLSCLGLVACPRPTDTPTDAGAASPDTSASPPVADPNQISETGEGVPANGAGTPPADATLAVDRSESSIGFAVARATVGHIGSFEQFEATLELAGGEPIKLEIAVKTGSVAADRTGLTQHLKGSDFFDVDKFPTATFTATEFTPDPEAGPDHYRIRGTMRLHGVASALEFPATLAIGPERVVGQATLDISAKAFGIQYAGMEAELAEDAVQLEIELVFPRVAGP
jgi:polyisoprenoid-binding protein YceI